MDSCYWKCCIICSQLEFCSEFISMLESLILLKILLLICLQVSNALMNLSTCVLLFGERERVGGGDCLFFIWYSFAVKFLVGLFYQSLIFLIPYILCGFQVSFNLLIYFSQFVTRMVSFWGQTQEPLKDLLFVIRIVRKFIIWRLIFIAAEQEQLLIQRL